MIVVHIGLRKAASSSLQAFLRDNESELRSSFLIDYPRIGRLKKRMAHHNIASEIQGRRQFDRKYGTLSQLTAYWRKAPSSVLVISSEIFEEAETSEIARMQNRLQKARGQEQLRAYLVLRNLVDLMPSSYSQKTKDGTGTNDFDRFFDQRIIERRVNYFDTASRWAQAVGWDNLAVRVLDPTHLVNGEISDDFLEVCGARTDALSDRLSRRGGESNVTPGWKVLEAVRALANGHHSMPPDHPLVQNFGTVDGKTLARCATIAGAGLGWNDDRGRYLSRSQAQRCLEIYRSNIESLNRYVSKPLPAPADLDTKGFVDRDFVPDVGYIPPAELSDFYDRLHRQIVLTQSDLRDGHN